MNLKNKRTKQTHRFRELMGVYQKGRGRGGEMDEENCVVMDGNQMYCGDNFVVFTKVELLCSNEKLI